MANFSGLTQERAEEFLRSDGPNQISESTYATWPRLLLRQFTSPAILVLSLTATIYGALGNAHDALILLAIILPSGLLTFFQEFRAENTMQELRQRLAVPVRVLRDEQERQIPIEDVVRGDVVLLAPGEMVPADLLVLDAQSLSVDESVLTGEAFPRWKDKQGENELFMGTHVVGGTAITRVVRTGSQTKYGEMADRIAHQDISTSFEKGIRAFGFLVARAIFFLVIFVFAGNLVLHRPIFESLLFSLALAVGLTPQMLPVIISVCLSAGARKLAQEKVLVKRLDAIEDLGTLELLCTDKTGTLTTGELTVFNFLDGSGNPSERALRLAVENATLQSSSSNAIDLAIKRSLLQFPLRKKMGEVDFSFARRRVSVLTEDHELISKGAFRELLDRSVALRIGENFEEITKHRDQLIDRYNSWSDSGFKIIAIASRPNIAIAEKEMIFEGFVLINDPAKPTARESLDALKTLKVELLLITGDSAQSALYIAGEVGISSARVIRGSELEQLSDLELLEVVTGVRVFAEINPLQKLRIVSVLREKGHVVGFLGDGINDAAALRLSDVAISVDDAADVAKSASSIVLLEKDLMVIADGVRIGRKTFENTLKYIRITISASFGNVVSMALASFFLPFLPMLPTQILLLNFLSDLPALAISSDRVDSEDLSQAKKWAMKDMGHFMVFFGLISTCFDLLVFFISLSIFDANEFQLRSTWFACSLWTEVIAILILRTRRRAWRSLPSRTLMALCCLVMVISLLVPLAGILSTFGLPHVGIHFSLLMIALGSGFAVATERAKKRLQREL
jgi:Mg2+-importing ATPase